MIKTLPWMDSFLDTLPELHDTETREWLFARFHDRSANPEGYDRKMDFWKRTVLAAIEKGLAGDGLFLASVDTLFESRFERDGLVPACLDAVLDRLLREGLLVERKETMLTRIKKSLLGILRMGDRKKHGETRWVYSRSLVEIYTQSLVRSANKTGLLLEEEIVGDCEKLAAKGGRASFQEQERELVLEELKKKLVCFADNGQLVFIVSDDKEAFSSLARLRKTKTKIEHQLDTLEEAAAVLDRRTRLLVKQNKKQAALVELKKKKEKEEEIKKHGEVLLNLLKMEESVRAAMNNKELHATIAHTTAHLKELLPDREEIDRLVLDTQEQIDETTEITERLGEISVCENTEALEEELRELVKEKSVLPETEAVPEEEAEEEHPEPV
ncbi:MAG: uncharacterized protein A8A55_1568 [Amphiamblys sp. WSBS2006]|nr:MAG: uncharacterized protein A8A55_1568 [Amphiamblys sp. WSBS2006]